MSDGTQKLDEMKHHHDLRNARLAKLEALLAEHNAEQAEPMWPSITPSPQLIDKHGGQPYEEGDDYIYWPN